MSTIYERIVLVLCGVPLGLLVALWLVWGQSSEAELTRLSGAAMLAGVAVVVMICIEHVLKRTRR